MIREILAISLIASGLGLLGRALAAPNCAISEINSYSHSLILYYHKLPIH